MDRERIDTDRIARKKLGVVQYLESSVPEKAKGHSGVGIGGLDLPIPEQISS